MDITSERGAKGTVLHLAGELTIYAVTEVRAALLDALADSTELELDLAAVTAVDTAGMQLLIAAKRSANEGQIAMRLLDHSAAVLEMIELYNLASWFGDPLVLAAEGVAA